MYTELPKTEEEFERRVEEISELYNRADKTPDRCTQLQKELNALLAESGLEIIDKDWGRKLTGYTVIECMEGISVMAFPQWSLLSTDEAFDLFKEKMKEIVLSHAPLTPEDGLFEKCEQVEKEVNIAFKRLNLEIPADNGTRMVSNYKALPGDKEQTAIDIIPETVESIAADQDRFWDRY